MAFRLRIMLSKHYETKSHLSNKTFFSFSSSIFDNISFGRVGSKEEVIKAAQDAQAHDFIMQLEHQYDTLIGEKGIQLSGGER